MVVNDRLWFMSGRILQYSGQGALVFLLPLVLLPAGFARLQLLLPVTHLLATFAGGWLAAAAARYVHARPSSVEGRVLRVAWQAHVLLLLGCLAVAVVIWLAPSPLPSLMLGFGDHARPLSAAAVLLVAASLQKTLAQSVLNSGGDGRVFAAASAGLALSPLLLIAILGWTASLHIALLSFAACDLAVCVIALRWCGVATPLWARSAGGWSDDLATIRLCMRYGGPVMLAGLGSWLIAWSDRYVLSFWVGADEVGRYVQSYQLSASIITIPLSFALTLLVPHALALERDSGLAVALQYVQGMQRIYLWLALPCGVIATLVVLLLQKYFYSEYALPPSVVAVLVAAHVLLGYTHFQNKRFELSGRTVELMRSLFLGAFVNVVANAVLVPFMGAAGAAWATLMAYGATVLWLGWRSRGTGSMQRTSAGASPPVSSH